MATWPTRKQYVGAVQRAKDSFRVSGLAQADFELDMMGMPTVSSGQTALVFRASIGPESKAVRVFTSGDESGQKRYRSLAEHQRVAHVPSIAEAIWMDDAIAVGTNAYPVVVMEWVEGDSLSKAVDKHVHDPARLSQLATTWQHQMEELRSARFAHGDLQHGNVIVDPSLRFRFIDLDGIWLPDLSNDAPTEFGQPDYQHPDRVSGAVWGEHIDWFSALLIYVSLKALAIDPSLWRYHRGENLIFLRSDFVNSSEIWKDLSAIGNPEVENLARILAASCDSDPLAATDLGEILRAGAAPGAPSVSTTWSQPAASSGTSTAGASTKTHEWWIVGTTTASVSTPAGASGSNSTPPPVTDDWWVDSGTAGKASPKKSTGPKPTAKATPKKPIAPRQRAKPKKQQVKSDWSDSASDPNDPSGYRISQTRSTSRKTAPPPPTSKSASARKPSPGKPSGSRATSARKPSRGKPSNSRSAPSPPTVSDRNSPPVPTGQESNPLTLGEIVMVIVFILVIVAFIAALN